MLKKIVFVILALIVLFIAGVYFFLHEPQPEGTPGPAADALAKKMMQAINHSQWDSTGAVSWNFRGIHQVLWDKDRHFARVRWEDNEALVNINQRSGIAYQNGAPLSGEAADELVEKGWRIWANDSFWLNPISKLFDDGTVRSIVDLEDGGKGLLIAYQSGGATPGDSYLWIVGEDGLPTHWQMWVSILPFGGLKFSWEEWITLSTGVKISTRHKSKLAETYISEVVAGKDLNELFPHQDPFAPLLP